MSITSVGAYAATQAASTAGKQVTVLTTSGASITGTARWDQDGTLTLFGVKNIDFKGERRTFTAGGELLSRGVTVSTSLLEPATTLPIELTEIATVTTAEQPADTTLGTAADNNGTGAE